MYTTAQSIENKVGGLSGWKDLLQAVGFRFEPSLNGLPPAVFFPQTDPGSRLTQASASLQALLGMLIFFFNSFPSDKFKTLPNFTDDNFKFDENGRKLTKWVENTVGKG